MELAELDVQLEELEIRLERLRALYEQYFLGIEKIEPTVARKDVDRRIWMLRREKIRNTAKRFKLQTIIQRYNTYQQYWGRICREIENGTYKRHLLRAEKAFGPQDLLTIAARKRLGRGAHAANGGAAAEGGNGETSDGAMHDSRSDVPPPEPTSTTAEAGPAEAPLPVEQRAGTSPPPVPGASQRRAPLAPPPPRGAAPSPAPGVPAPGAAASAPRKSLPSSGASRFESLELDMDFLGDWDPSGQAVKPLSPRSTRPPPPASAPPAASPAAAKPLAKPPPIRRPPPVPAAAAAERPLNKVGKAPEALSEDRVRELHGRLNDLKRQNREAGQVSFEGLAKSLKATEEKLRKQHAGRNIDFDVVVKDGKAVVKPIIR